MKKFINLFSIVAISILVLTACNKSWYTIEEKEVYEHEIFVEVIKDFMEKRWG